MTYWWSQPDWATDAAAWGRAVREVAEVLGEALPGPGDRILPDGRTVDEARAAWGLPPIASITELRALVQTATAR